MDYRITARDRAAFKRCRRRWDLGATERRDLVPVGAPPEVDLGRVLSDALAAYYFPGMWDWDSGVVLPLVRKALARSLGQRAAGEADTALAETLLAAYVADAPSLDDFSPIKIDHDLEVVVAEPADPDSGMLTPDGGRVWYQCRVDLLAVDADDAYWLVCHRLVADWLDTSEMLLDEEAVTACWAWEQTYLGMQLAGTIHNELSIATVRADPPNAGREPPSRAGIAQSQPSGGGRSIPQHRRLYRPEHGGAGTTERLTQRSAGPLRRTYIRRGRGEVAIAGSLLAEQAREMVDPELAIYPAPSPAHCADCAFLTPCLAMTAGGDPEPLLAEQYRVHEVEDRPRLGATTWGSGRGTGTLLR
jgi:hypothetical protein